ncbi:restriction endonuclease subunit S [Mycoplasma hafezii]|uniref:restriction endonuclease subunit S n=1 Tax=Mycoplasma hafezii TaxID=525886 RepID=UPI003CE72092
MSWTIYIYINNNWLSNVPWKEFFLSEICEIRSGIRLTKSEMNDGEIPFIGATEFNNGITSFISNTNESLDSNILGVNYNGSVCDSFYHPYQCVFSDDVKRLSFINPSAQNKYCYLFLKQMITQQKIKYKYGYKFNAERMKKQKIMLPVDENNNVNYVFMESFMKVKELKLILSYLRKINI